MATMLAEKLTFLSKAKGKKKKSQGGTVNPNPFRMYVHIAGLRHFYCDQTKRKKSFGKLKTFELFFFL